MEQILIYIVVSVVSLFLGMLITTLCLSGLSGEAYEKGLYDGIEIGAARKGFLIRR